MMKIIFGICLVCNNDVMCIQKNSLSFFRCSGRPLTSLLQGKKQNTFKNFFQKQYKITTSTLIFYTMLMGTFHVLLLIIKVTVKLSVLKHAFSGDGLKVPSC